MKFFTKLLGDPNKKVVARMQPLVDKVGQHEPEMEKLSDEGIRAKTGEFKERFKSGESLDDLMPEAFALVREAAKRSLGQRHYDVQLMGGYVLHQGQIAEMRTGEGKTLVGTLAVYLNALAEKGVHVVTVNDYLARRDAAWMGQVYQKLGLTVGCIGNQMGAWLYDEAYLAAESEEEAEEQDVRRDERASFEVDMDYMRPVGRQEAYRADITYGTNNEFGFDYLRDNMVTDPAQMVQRGHHYAVIDEIDSILIDEARTPLIISAPAEESTDLYYKFADLVKRLREDEHYNVDEKMRAVSFTDEGQNAISAALGADPWASQDLEAIYHIEAALRAHALFSLDKEYVVRDDEVIIVDEFTGRLMPGRRYSEGLHQAIEAKEGVKIQRESRTLATVTFQNFFRLYEKLSGMTGTAATEAEEFSKIYKLEVTSIPTNRPIRRDDLPDRVFKTRKGKYQALIRGIKERQDKGQPVLVGTVNIDQNELLSAMLKREGVEHSVLNAKQHESEGGAIAQAGRRGHVTIATNMAGRGVDIVLGGAPLDPAKAEEVKNLGGLCVIGTERHDSRRIDNQLRGRAGRQGDPGVTQFYLSMEDDLMRIFGSDKMKNMMDRLGIPEDMPIENKIISKSIESAQKKVEGHNFDTRKHLLEYDDVLNKHRSGFYRRRNEILDADDDAAMEKTFEMVEGEVEQVVLFHTSSEDHNDWNIEEIYEVVQTIFPVPKEARVSIEGIWDKLEESKGDKVADIEGRTVIIEYLTGIARAGWDEMKQGFGDLMPKICKGLPLRAMDTFWVQHLDSIDHLRKGIGLRGYGQRDPLVEYKKEAYRMWNELLHNISRQVVYSIYKAQIGGQTAKSLLETRGVRMAGAAKTQDAKDAEGSAPTGTGNVAPQPAGPGMAREKVGRNEPCPCGATKEDGTPIKYKHCHGKNE